MFVYVSIFVHEKYVYVIDVCMCNCYKCLCKYMYVNIIICIFYEGILNKCIWKYICVIYVYICNMYIKYMYIYVKYVCKWNTCMRIQYICTSNRFYEGICKAIICNMAVCICNIFMYMTYVCCTIYM